MPVLTCEHCKQEFTVPLRRSEKVRFCSWNCKKAHNNTECLCAQCGNAFSVPNSVADKGGGKFCSRKCKSESLIDPAARGSRHRIRKRREPLMLLCHECGSEFSVPPVRLSTAKFCSTACRYKNADMRRSMSEKNAGSNSPRWKGGVYKRRGDGYVLAKAYNHPFANGRNRVNQHRLVMEEWMREECPDHPFMVEVEGEKYLSPKIDVHHIDRVRDNNARDNLIAVTKDAHQRIHNNGTPPRPWECWPNKKGRV